LGDLEPLTTGLLAQEGIKIWHYGDRAALGLKPGGIAYPVFPHPFDPRLIPGARMVLERLPESWCLMGPAPWVAQAEAFLPPSRISHRIAYDFLVRPRAPFEVLAGPGEPRPCREDEGEALFPLQEAYEKEEVLFDPEEFQGLASRLHFWKLLRKQDNVALWEGGRPTAKAGTNAQTPAWAQIGGVYTRKELRGGGRQRRLLSYFLDRLAHQGRGACLFVKKSNPGAAALYRSLGFVDTGDFTILYGQRRLWTV